MRCNIGKTTNGPSGGMRSWAGRSFLLALSALILGACAGHTVYLVGRSNGLTAENKFRIIHPPAAVSFKLGNEVYTGRWVYMEGAGSVGIETATTVSGAHSAATTGTLIGLPSGGSGTFIGASQSGATLRCSFTFSEWNLKGLGECQDSKGEVYDLQISD